MVHDPENKSGNVGEDYGGSPYLYDQDSDVSHRDDDTVNPGQWDQGRLNPNHDIVDIPERIEDPTALEWMD